MFNGLFTCRGMRERSLHPALSFTDYVIAEDLQVAARRISQVREHLNDSLLGFLVTERMEVFLLLYYIYRGGNLLALRYLVNQPSFLFSMLQEVDVILPLAAVHAHLYAISLLL